MNKLLLTTLATLTLMLPFSLGARERLSGYCEQGGATVSTLGHASTTTVQRSYASCTVTVFAAGTTNISAIFSDDSGTVLANPFTAASDGFWFFYADNGRYDVKFSGAGITTPYTRGDFSLLDPKSIGSVRNACLFTGANMGAKITAAIADLPSTGGIVDARCFEGNQSATSTISINKPVTVLQGVSNLTLSANPGIQFVTGITGAAWVGLGRAQSTLTKGISGTMINIQSSATQVRLVGMEAVGATFTGGAITLTAGNSNLIDNVYITETQSDAVEITADTNIFTVVSNSLIQTLNSASFSYQLVGNDAGGPFQRGIYNIRCGGSSIDVAGSETVLVEGVACNGVVMNGSSKKVMLVGNRLATAGVPLALKGKDCVASGNAVAGPIDLDDTAENCLVVGNTTTAATTMTTLAKTRNTVLDNFGTTIFKQVGIGVQGTASTGLLSRPAVAMGLSGTNQVGIQSAPICTSGATTECIGILTRAELDNATFNTVNAYGMFIQNAVRGGAGATIGTSYGLFIKQQDQGATNFGLYVEGVNTNNRIEGPTELATLVIGSPTPTAGPGKIGYGATTSSTVGAAGAASALPATPEGYLVINVSGTPRKIPFYLQ